MFNSDSTLVKLLQNYFWPFFLATLPFFPNIYERFQDERDFIVYETTYKKIQSSNGIVKLEVFFKG